MAPWDAFPAERCLKQDFLGTNVGNLAYAYSLYRNLTTEYTEIVSTYYHIHEESAQINQDYDMFIIPLADAFRESFIPTLQRLTRLIGELTIPVCVIGAGLRAPFEPNLKDGFPFDSDVKAFVHSVLDHSDSIGIRGQITADYLARLGFKDKIQIIGCPSMYTYGPDLPIRTAAITSDSLICTNYSPDSPETVIKYLRNLSAQHKVCFIPQNTEELYLMYAGAPWVRKQSSYPQSIQDYEYQPGNAKFFLNMPTWIEYLKNATLCIGTRLHGNIVSLVAGTPSVVIPKDARMRELAEYHLLPQIPISAIAKEVPLKQIVAQVDYHSVVSRQVQTHQTFIDFLNRNNIDHVYHHHYDTNLFDERMKHIEQPSPIETITVCEPAEIARRLDTFHRAMPERRIDQLKEHNEKLGATISALRKEMIVRDKIIGRQAAVLDSAIVKPAVGLRTLVARTGIVKRLRSR